MEIDRPVPVPEAAVGQIDQVSQYLGLVARTGEEVVISWRNTIAMSHAVIRSLTQIRVELDWGLIERILMLGHLFWGMKGERLWSQRVTGFLEQEVFLAAARASILRGDAGIASNMQAAYENFEFRDRLPHRIDAEKQVLELTWYIIFATFRELGRPIVEADWELALAGVIDMVPDVSPEVLVDERLVRELYLDNAGVNAVARHEPRSIERSALSELVLYVTVEEVHRKAAIVARHAGGMSDAFEFALDQARRHDHELRFNLLYGRSHNHAEEFDDPAIARKVRSGAEVADRFQLLMQQALDYGLPKLRECDWLHMRSFGAEAGLEDNDWVDDRRRDEILRNILAYAD